MNLVAVLSFSTESVVEGSQRSGMKESGLGEK